MGRTSYTGNKLSVLIAETNEISSSFDLPLVFRRELSEGYASAQLQMLPDLNLEIKTLTGTPEIRASLFATLTRESSKSHLKALFHNFRQSSLLISVEYHTDHAASNSREFETKLKVFENEVVISITRYTNAPSYGVTGVPLEDRHSLASKARDRAELSALRGSLAYRQSISNFRLQQVKTYLLRMSHPMTIKSCVYLKITSSHSHEYSAEYLENFRDSPSRVLHRQRLP